MKGIVVVTTHAQSVDFALSMDKAEWSPALDITPFASGLVNTLKLKADRWTEPVLAAKTGGVGPKLGIAAELDLRRTIGIDLVAAVVDGLVASGAEPLFLQDYITVSKMVPEWLTELRTGTELGAAQAGCPLLGGGMCEQPSIMSRGELDMSATAVGIQESEQLWGADLVRPGDVILAMGATGLHTSGYELVRHVLVDIARMPLEGHVEEFGRTLGEELLEPSRIYAKELLALRAEAEVRAFAQIGKDGIASALARVIPGGLVAQVERGTWTPSPLFALIGQRGKLSRERLEERVNMGIGMIAVVSRDDVDRALALLTARHVPAWAAGEIVKATETGHRAVLVGDHPRF
ncbi:phosphoribosylformylglycinamidine cyclo-ligase [Pseudonocardiaceae bacterium YIM PH 21723]|nr:phosphoribosylformylglycinamidine cyclo-ligase [Pseudonocardiaceae bacterium YIM PH 21723]